MKRLLLLTAALATCFPVFAPVAVQADTVGAVTVSACGTPPNTPVVGGSYPLTMDTTGRLCDGASGSTPGQTVVVGDSASGATDSGSNPVKIGTIAWGNAAHPSYTQGQRGNFAMSLTGALYTNLMDINGNQLLFGAATTDASASGTLVGVSNYGHVWNGSSWDRQYSSAGANFTTGTGVTASGIMAVYNSSLTAPTTGQYSVAQATADGSIRTAPVLYPGAGRTGLSSNLGQAYAQGFQTQVLAATQNLLWNGTTSDAMFSAPGAAGNSNSGQGVLAVEEAGRTYTNITTATSTQVKATKGFLHKIIVNTAVAAATITIYDNTSCATTKVGTITLPATATPMVLEYNIGFATGLCITTSGATDLTIAYR